MASTPLMTVFLTMRPMTSKIWSSPSPLTMMSLPLWNANVSLLALMPFSSNERMKRVHANFGKDYVELFFKNGSRLAVVGALDSDRGIRTHATLIDEARDQDGDAISEIVLPQMNVSRRMVNGRVNEYEKINTQVIWATSAGTKSSFAYGALIDVFERAIIDPKTSFCIGLDYRVPMRHGLVSEAYVKQLKMSPSYNENTFAAEYMGVWLGGSDESWF